MTRRTKRATAEAITLLTAITVMGTGVFLIDGHPPAKAAMESLKAVAVGAAMTAMVAGAVWIADAIGRWTVAEDRD